jgi:uncharacterized protein (TIGR00369 family)
MTMEPELSSAYEPDNPFRALLGVAVTEVGPGTATVVIDPIAPVLLQARGIVHGGVYATLVDCATGEALRTVMPAGQEGFTVDLNLTYLRPVTSSRLLAYGRAVRCGRTVGVATADIHDGDGTLVATGRATFAVRPEGTQLRAEPTGAAQQSRPSRTRGSVPPS